MPAPCRSTRPDARPGYGRCRADSCRKVRAAVWIYRCRSDRAAPRIRPRQPSGWRYAALAAPRRSGYAAQRFYTNSRPAGAE